MQQLQQKPSAEAYASLNFGVRGFRGTPNLPASVSYINPTRSLPAETDSSPLNEAEEAAVLQQRFDHWNKMRRMQDAAISRKIGPKDIIKLVFFTLLFQRTVNLIGLRARVVVPVLAVLALLKSIWTSRAPAKYFPLEPTDYTVWPILGQIGVIPDLFEAGSSVFQQRLGKLRKFRTGELVMFGKPNEVSLMDPADRKYMLRTNWKNFVKNLDDGSGFQEKFAELMGRGVFAVDGEEWADQRKVASHMFSANALKLKMERSFTEHGHKVVELMRPIVGETVNFQEIMSNLTFETICDIAFGVAPGSLEAGFHEGRKIDFLVQFDRLQQNSALRFVFPEPVWKTMRFLNVGFERQIREDGKAMREYVREMVHKQTEGDENLVSLYKKTGKQTGKLFMLEDDYLIDTVQNFQVAGRDTTSCLLTNMFKLMTKEVEHKMLEEFERVVGKTGDVKWDDVRNLPYCSAVVNETLRMYPPVGFEVRSVKENDTFPSGIRVKAGDNVVLPLITIGRDPNLFERPDEFLPERWIVDPSKPVARPDELVFPVFWGGPRLCLGKDMARLEALNIAYTLLKAYRFEVLPHSEKITLGPVQFYEDGLPVRVHLRV